MVYNTEFKSLVSAKEKYADTSDVAKKAFREWNLEKEKLARQADTFGGRRLLGVTKNNQPIWVSFTIDKATLTIQAKVSHTFDTIRESKLCPRRITLATNENLNDLEHAMRPSTKQDHGGITLNSINYLEKLMDLLDSSYIGRVDGKCSTQLFMHASNYIYEGSPEANKFRWSDVMKTWNMPSGQYLTIYG